MALINTISWEQEDKGGLVLQQATKFYEACMPIEALHKLEELKKEFEESLQLKKRCINMLVQQAPYLLKEYQSDNDFVEMRHLIEEYKKYVGNDKAISTYSKSCAVYEAKRKEQQIEMDIKNARKTEKNVLIIVSSILALLYFILSYFFY